MAHGLTIARSKKILGPYVANPQHPLLTNCSLAGQTMQIQGTGHGDFVQATDGSWWVVFLAYRNFGGAYHHIGRETCLAPVEWKKGQWPVINGGQPIDTVMQVKTLAPQKPWQHRTRTIFNNSKLSPEWIYLQNPIPSNYEFDGQLWLKAHGTLTENNQPTFLGRRQESVNIVVETEIDIDQLDFATEAGLTVYQINDGHMDLTLEKYQTGSVAVKMRYQIKSLQGDLMGDDSGQLQGKVRLRITSDGTQYRFEYAQTDGDWKLIASHDCPLVSTEVVGGFTGVTLGMFVEGEGRAAFRYFDYTEK
jgi:alpha-N-arabinofuranosidase